MDSSMLSSQPVSLMGSVRAGKLVPIAEPDTEEQLKDREIFVAAITAGAEGSEPFKLDKWISAGQFYVTKDHYGRVKYLHDTLDKAVTDIVERWYSDEEALFTARMPFRENEDKLLRVNQPHNFSAYLTIFHLP